MRKIAHIIFFLMFIYFPTSALAVHVKSIYQASIPVASQGLKDKANATQMGLSQVLIKVSGNVHLLEDNPGLKANIAHADTLAQQYSYIKNEKSKNFTLKIQFDPEAINKLLRETGSPIWGTNRPLILVWLALETPTHPLDLVDGSMLEIQTLVKQANINRGVPMILPVLDATELAQVSVNDVMAKSLPNLQRASKRYQSDGILIGHVSEIDGEYNSQWQLVLGADQWSWDVSGKSLPEVMNGIIDNLSDTLAGRFATLVANDVQTKVSLKVAGVKNETDLLQLMKYLQHLTPVVEVQLEGVAEDSITLAVNLRANKQTFTHLLANSKKLTPNTNAPAVDDAMQYKWLQ